MRQSILMPPAVIRQEPSIKLPDTITELGFYSFDGCSQLAQVQLPAGLKVTKSNAFEDCIALKEITIPASVTTLGPETFYGCSALTKIVFEGSKVQFGDIMDGDVFYGVTATAYYPACDESWGTPTTTSGGTITWEKYVTEHSFGEWSELQGVTCTQVGTQTRTCNCGETETRKVALTAGGHSWDAGTVIQESSSYYGTTICFTCNTCGDTVTLETKPGIMISASGVCGDSAAWYLTTDHELVISGTGAMYDGSVLSQKLRSSVWKITVEEGITRIGEQAFNRYCNATSVSLPQTLGEIGSLSFSCCNQLKYVALPEGLRIIGNWAFEYCHGLTRLTLPGSLEKYTGAFRECSYLQTVVLKQGITEVDSNAFSNCKALISVVLPDSVTTIDHYAFSGCTRLKDVNLPVGLTFIGVEAFYSCGLKEVYIPHTVTAIGSGAFSSCTFLATVNIPYGITALLPSVFSYTPKEETLEA